MTEEIIHSFSSLPSLQILKAAAGPGQKRDERKCTGSILLASLFILAVRRTNSASASTLRLHPQQPDPARRSRPHPPTPEAYTLHPPLAPQDARESAQPRCAAHHTPRVHCRAVFLVIHRHRCAPFANPHPDIASPPNRPARRAPLLKVHAADSQAGARYRASDGAKRARFGKKRGWEVWDPLNAEARVVTMRGEMRGGREKNAAACAEVLDLKGNTRVFCWVPSTGSVTGTAALTADTPTLVTADISYPMAQREIVLSAAEEGRGGMSRVGNILTEVGV
ncbi:hypothetical protein C8J57DRAFT_1672865 [Mycena rebaudengoi]|nr:hypothetical protein C8J57DRAFT_1672865 [Mycena rebaudengoi]